MGTQPATSTKPHYARILTFFCIICLACVVAFIQSSILVSRAHAQGASITVQITGSTQPPGFSPAFLTVHLYDTLVFINQSVPAATYAIAAQDGSFASPAITHGEQWTLTVNTTGPHPYSVSSSTAMIGEIFVVANTVSLLPTPIPQAQATAGTALAAGKNPPDVMVLPTTSSTMQNGAGQIASPFNSLLILVVILNSILTVSMLIAFVTWLLLRRRATKAASLEGINKHSEQKVGETSGGALAGFFQQETRKTKRRFFWQRNRDDEDDLDMDDSEE